jgi:hypothetical protein
MNIEDVKGFVDRDWTRLNRLKREAWLAQYRARNPQERLEAASRLNDLTRTLRPAWPTPREIEADRTHHLRMIDAFRRVQP